jgi:hypothetical protein
VEVKARSSCWKAAFKVSYLPVSCPRLTEIIEMDLKTGEPIFEWSSKGRISPICELISL